MTRTTTLVHALGAGTLAGLAGTAAMTVSSTLEMRLRRRAPSSAPARAAAKVLGISGFGNDSAEQRFGTLVHWGYGTGWGVFRGMLAATGMSTAAATGGHAAVMWGSEQVMLPALGVAPPLTKWGSKRSASTPGTTWCTSWRPSRPTSCWTERTRRRPGCRLPRAKRCLVQDRPARRGHQGSVRRGARRLPVGRV